MIDLLEFFLAVVMTTRSQNSSQSLKNEVKINRIDDWIDKIRSVFSHE